MSFLDAEVWRGRLYAGSWEAGAGGTREVREPATGATGLAENYAGLPIGF